MNTTIIIDENIPFIQGVFEPVANVVYRRGAEIDRNMLLGTGAEVLIVRTRTRCNEALLSGTKVRFIATATIGIDHIDTDYCARAGIAWSNAPGCNARSVAQYVGSAMALYAHEEGVELSDFTLGIVGHGHVGVEVEKLAKKIGMEALLCDPFKAEIPTPGKNYITLEQLASQSDIITIHTPLTNDGPHPTANLINARIFGLMPRRPLIINAARGGIVDEWALLSALQNNTVAHAVVDCWENEPHINRQLLERALIATPHIAGYSADGKHHATGQVTDAVAGHLKTTPAPIAPLDPCRHVSADSRLPFALLANYPIYRDSDALKTAPTQFEYLRNHYPIRRELDID